MKSFELIIITKNNYKDLIKNDIYIYMYISKQIFLIYDLRINKRRIKLIFKKLKEMINNKQIQINFNFSL